MRGEGGGGVSPGGCHAPGTQGHWEHSLQGSGNRFFKAGQGRPWAESGAAEAVGASLRKTSRLNSSSTCLPLV